MTTSDLRIIGLEVTDDINEHHMIDFALQVHDSNDRTKLKTSLNYKRANFELMKEELNSFDDERTDALKLRCSSSRNESRCRLHRPAVWADSESPVFTAHYFPFGTVRDPPLSKRLCSFRTNASTNFLLLSPLHLLVQGLIAKVEAHGIRGNCSRWIRNWFTGRTQRVMIHDQGSNLTHVTSGVPQGSVLDPLFFIFYINALYVKIISKINKFADDTKLSDKAFTEWD
ncbi:Reverse transcriptase domain [Trinorchestia longiramus]|nr:Reverse transcriptase domain [Trinorchestia longiramus]